MLVGQQARLQSDTTHRAPAFVRDYRDPSRARPDDTLLTNVSYRLHP